ncbi:glycoside hydrolase [Caulobacter segnis]
MKTLGVEAHRAELRPRPGIAKSTSPIRPIYAERQGARLSGRPSARRSGERPARRDGRHALGAVGSTISIRRAASWMRMGRSWSASPIAAARCASSEALCPAQGPFVPAQRYAGHIADGANQVFVDVDAFGDFHEDQSPDHPMSMARDRANLLARLGLTPSTGTTGPGFGERHGLEQRRRALLSRHGTGPCLGDLADPGRPKAVRRLLAAGSPGIFFKPFQPTPDEARLLFGAADRLPLFEAAFHDSVVAADRWEFGLMKVPSEARRRFARSLLYGTPTMWSLDRGELARGWGTWLKAAQDDFRLAHGVTTPVALTGFRWLTPDRLVQQVTYADGRVLTANFGVTMWRGLGQLRKGGRTEAAGRRLLPTRRFV